MAPPKLHGRVRIGLPELHGRIRMVWPKLHGRFRMVWPKLHGRFRMVWPKFGILYWDSICSHQICTVGVFWHTLSIMQEKHWKNLFEIEWTVSSTYEAVSEWVTERLLREDKTHSTGLTLTSWCQMNRDSHSSPVMHKVEGKPHEIVEKMKI